jgi:hypothetical protein
VPLKNIVIKAEFTHTHYLTPTSFYTLTLEKLNVLVLAPDEFAPFTVFGGGGILDPPPTVTLSTVSWTVASEAENQPISVTAVLTSTLISTSGEPIGTKAIVYVRNALTVTLRNVEVTAWTEDESGRFSCTFVKCFYSRRVLPILLAGEELSSTANFVGPRLNPEDTIHVSAHGVISP